MSEQPDYERLRDTPISAPIWVWLTYFALVIGMAALAEVSAARHEWAWPWVIFTAAFSFQFWTFAAWNGRRRTRPAEPDCPHGHRSLTECGICSGVDG